MLYHGTKADLKVGDLIGPGVRVQLRQEEEGGVRLPDSHAGCRHLGAELASGDGRGRIYIVEPTGPFEDDPNLTDKKFPGNPTKSYGTREPLRVVGEVSDWQGHSPEQLKAMKEHRAHLERLGVEPIED